MTLQEDTWAMSALVAGIPATKALAAVAKGASAMEEHAAVTVVDHRKSPQELAKHLSEQHDLDSIEVRRLQRKCYSKSLRKPWGLQKHGDLWKLALLS